MSKCRVLLVDDEEAYVETLAKRLTRRGLTVFTANRGERALEVLAGNPVDVVILDMKMPGMDGIETLTRIKRDHADVEVIIAETTADKTATDDGREDVTAGRMETQAVLQTADGRQDRPGG